MKKPSEILITKVESAKSKKYKTITFYEEIRNIRYGTYKNEILECRNALSKGDLSGYKKLKENLPAVTFSGHFLNGRSLSHLETYNNIMVIDIDKIDEKVFSTLRENLKQDHFTLAMWASPSGKGLKCLFRISCDSVNHKSVFNSISQYFQKHYKIEIDKSGSDITRLCFSSWDEQIFYNNNSKIYKDLITAPKKIVSQNIKTIIPKRAIDLVLDNNDNIKQINDIIEFLTRKQMSITETHYKWLRIGIYLANNFSYERGKKYFLVLSRLDGDRHDEIASTNLFDNLYSKAGSTTQSVINIATVIKYAKEKGYKKSIGFFI